MCYYVNEWLDNQEFIFIFAHVNILKMQIKNVHDGCFTYVLYYVYISTWYFIISKR